MPEKTIYRKNYQPPAFTVSTIALDFDLYDDHAVVVNRMQLKRQQKGDLHLYGDELELVSVQMNGKPLDKTAYRLQEGDLIIDILPR